MYFSLCCKNALSLYDHVRSACVCIQARTHNLSADVAVSVGPVRGAAVARLVDLALLLQAAGLAPLTRTALKNKKEVRLLSRTSGNQKIFSALLEYLKNKS